MLARGCGAARAGVALCQWLGQRVFVRFAGVYALVWQHGRALGCVLLVYLFFDVFEFLQGTDAVLHGTASVRVAGAQCQNGLL